MRIMISAMKKHLKKYVITLCEWGRYGMIEEVPDLPKDDELPDYGNNCETWAITVDTNPTMVLINDKWEILE